MKKMINNLYYIYRRNNWVFDFSRFFKDYDNIKINRPIFLLGVQGGGLTLVSRMLRRNRDIVSVTGNYNYWYGADEMQNVLWPILPSQLTGIKHKFPSKKVSITPTGWLYATNKLIKGYRNDKKDVTPHIKKEFRKIIRWQIARHAVNPAKARFTDKSQVFSVKVNFINEMLKDCNPKFVLIVRNPYAVCYRSVNKKNVAPELKKAIKIFGYKKTLDLAAQHWTNTIKYATKDGNQLTNFTTIRIEDILQNPEKNLKKICQFAEIKFENDMLPKKEHLIGHGERWSASKKWYPIRKNLNSLYLKKMTKKERSIIHKRCYDYAKKFNY